MFNFSKTGLFGWVFWLSFDGDIKAKPDWYDLPMGKK
jgi:hypothetical protein